MRKDTSMKRTFSASQVARIAKAVVAMSAQEFSNTLTKSGALSKSKVFKELKDALSHLRKALQDKNAGWMQFWKRYDAKDTESKMIDALFAGDVNSALAPIKKYYICKRSLDKFVKNYPNDEAAIKEKIDSAKKKEKVLSVFDSLEETVDDTVGRIDDCIDFWQNCAENADTAIENAIESKQAIEALSGVKDEVVDAIKAVASTISNSLDASALENGIKAIRPVYELVKNVQVKDNGGQEQPGQDQKKEEGNNSGEEMTAEKVEEKFNNPEKQQKIVDEIKNKEKDLFDTTIEGALSSVSKQLENIKLDVIEPLYTDDLPSGQTTTPLRTALSALYDDIVKGFDMSYCSQQTAKLKQLFSAGKFIELENTVDQIPGIFNDHIKEICGKNNGNENAVKIRDATIEKIKDTLNKLPELIKQILKKDFYNTDPIRNARLRQNGRLTAARRIARKVAVDTLRRLG